MKLQVPAEGFVKPIVIWMTRFLHLKTRRRYILLSGAKAAGDIAEGDVVVVYANPVTSEWYVRRHDEFHDGRFQNEDL